MCGAGWINTKFYGMRSAKPQGAKMEQGNLPVMQDKVRKKSCRWGWRPHPSTLPRPIVISRLWLN